jgi:hypothetical protein
MAYISPVTLGNLVNALNREESPLVKAAILRDYVGILDACNGTMKNARDHYERARSGYLGIISQLNENDAELIKVFKKRADYCKEKASITRKE